MAKVTLTREGLKKLEEEVNMLKSVKRPEVAAKIQEARELGDLSENSEYDAALDAQAALEARIGYIEEQLKDYEIIDDAKVKKNIVSVGSRVTVYDEDMEEEDVYDIVGRNESDPKQNKISDQSPVGMALLGAKKGDKVTVKAPGEEFVLEIRKIERF